MATSPAIDSSWLLDSGAFHHVTNDLTALSLDAPYTGNEELIIGDGSPFKLLISVICLSTFPILLFFCLMYYMLLKFLVIFIFISLIS